jgi:hypothetical protein
VVTAWTDHPVAGDIAPEGLDDAIAAAAGAEGTDEPFVFLVEGAFRDVRLHVIHGACPLHARRNGVELAAGEQPFAGEWDRLEGTLVGVYAENAAGEITHPGTRTHSHLVFTDERTGKRITGHLERVGIEAGAVLRIPRSP